MTDKPVPDSLTTPDFVTMEGVARKAESTGSLKVDRVPVPGGWLYVTTHFSGHGYEVALHTTFVPTPPDEGTFSGISRDAFSPGGLDRHRK